MAKKGLFVLVLAAFAVGGVWAQTEFSVSAGVGGLFGSDFGGGVDASREVAGQPVSSKTETPYFGGGGCAFLDVTYAELTLAFFAGGGKYKGSSTVSGTTNSTELDWSITNLNICLLLKYPIEISYAFSLFPLLGIDYGICLSAKIDGNDIEDRLGDHKAGDFSALWFKAGAGGDIAFTDEIYLRLEALYGIRLANKYETDIKDSFEKNNSSADVKTLFGHGLTAKLAVGFKFF
jgi:hypothetical protein